MVVALQLSVKLFLPLQIGTALVVISGASLGVIPGVLIGALSRLVLNFFVGQGPWTIWQMASWALMGALAAVVFARPDRNIAKLRSAVAVAIHDKEQNDTRYIEKTNNNVGKIVGIAGGWIFWFLVSYITYILWPGDEGYVGWRLYVFGFFGLLTTMVILGGRIKASAINLAVFTFLVTFVFYGGIMNLAALVMNWSSGRGETLSLKALSALYISGAPYDAVHGFTAAICAYIIGPSMLYKLERVKIKYGLYKIREKRNKTNVTYKS